MNELIMDCEKTVDNALRYSLFKISKSKIWSGMKLTSEEIDAFSCETFKGLNDKKAIKILSKKLSNENLGTEPINEDEQKYLEQQMYKILP